MGIIKLPTKPEQSEYYQSCLELAKMRMECYLAHKDAGFDHEESIMFTQIDTDQRGNEEPYIEFELDEA